MPALFAKIPKPALFALLLAPVVALASHWQFHSALQTSQQAEAQRSAWQLPRAPDISMLRQNLVAVLRSPMWGKLDPGAQAAGNSAVATAADAAPDAQRDAWILVAIITDGPAKIAVLWDAPAHKAHRLAVGDAVGDKGRLRSIEDNQITVQRDGAVETLYLYQ